MSKDARRFIRSCLPSHVEFGSEGVHSRPLTEDIAPIPLDEDYAAQTIGGAADHGDLGSPGWAGDSSRNASEDVNLEETFRRVTMALNEYASGNLPDDQKIGLFNTLIRTGLIEYMNDPMRDAAQALVRAGYVTTRVSEAEAFSRNVSGQDAQAGTPNIQVRTGSAMPKANRGTAPVSTASDIGSQAAQSGPAQVPMPPTGAVTSKGYAKFPDSGGSKENPAKIKRAAGTQKAGPHNGDEMSGGHGGIKVGNSLRQGLDHDHATDDFGSRVGSIGEADDEPEEDVPGNTCPVLNKKSDDDERDTMGGNSQPRRPRRRRRPEPR